MTGICIITRHDNFKIQVVVHRCAWRNETRSEGGGLRGPRIPVFRAGQCGDRYRLPGPRLPPQASRLLRCKLRLTSYIRSYPEFSPTGKPAIDRPNEKLWHSYIMPLGCQIRSDDQDVHPTIQKCPPTSSAMSPATTQRSHAPELHLTADVPAAV